MEYHKIVTVWKRDPENNYRTLIQGEWATPELEYLSRCEWTFTEKVDGTNTRIHVNKDGGVSIGGKTNKAQLSPELRARLLEIGDRAADTLEQCALSTFDRQGYSRLNDDGMILYGEGYGPKIQTGGKYRSDIDFVLFDVFCGMWLQRNSVREIAETIGVDVIPVIGCGTLLDGIDIVRRGQRSVWGNFLAEGLVMRPVVELADRRGQRIITKIKVKDFE